MTNEVILSNKMDRYRKFIEKANLDFKEYQYQGVEWCVRNELRLNTNTSTSTLDLSGGFIADEMGLGKTITMIGTMVANYMPKTLIVVPPILLKQWYDEILRTTRYNSVIYHGANKKHCCLDNPRIVLTTYNTLLSKSCALKQVAWSRVIFDEAHHLRNASCKRFRSCKELVAPIRWLVTGTPIQNKKKDFYNLCNMLGMPKDFYMDSANFKQIGNDFVLRRKKDEVGILLPPVHIHSCQVNWDNASEKSLAEEIHSLVPGHTHVDASKKKNISALLGNYGVLVLLMRARQTCIMSKLMQKNIEVFRQSGFIQDEYLDIHTYTSKVNAVVEAIVARKDNNRGKIVFCHYREEIDHIANELKAHGMSKVICYDGRNSGNKQLNRICIEAPDALIIQIQTGCEGLNLQKYFSEIYFVSPSWNPFVEEQAIARCHRIGQVYPVDVFRFQMSNFDPEEDVVDLEKEAEVDDIPITIERHVTRVQDAKRQISREMLSCHV